MKPRNVSQIIDGLEKYPVTYSKYAIEELRRLQAEAKEWEVVCKQHLRHIKKLKQQLSKGETCE